MVDKYEYNNPKTFERSLIEHVAKYKQAVKDKDGYQISYQYGAIKSMERVLEFKFNYTQEQIRAIKNGQR